MANLDGVNPELAFRVQALINASHGRITVQSGYRTEAQQAQLYKSEPNLAAPPGHSNHEKGLAVDLGGDYALIAQLAPQFGLVLPMSWEPWHVELPGTHKGSDPSAYTVSPYGDANPTSDPNLETSGPYTLAVASDAMRKLTGPVGEVTGPLGEQTGPTGAGVTPDTTASAPATGTPNVQGTGHFQDARESVSLGGGQGGSISPAALYKELRAQGVDPLNAAALVGIAGRESGYNAGAENLNAQTGDQSYGLFQVNLMGGMHSQYSPQMLTTVGGSVQAAADLVKSGGLGPWGGYKGMSWAHGGVDLAAAAAASGGEVTLAQLEAYANQGH